MFGRFQGNEKKIVVGVNLPLDEELIRSSIGLAKRTGMSLRLTHAVIPRDYSSALFPGEYLASNIARIANEENIEIAKKALEDETKLYLKDIEFETNVMVGTPIDVLIRDSTAVNASLIVTGFKQTSHRFVPTGFSTAVGLMAESTIPVLAIPEGQFQDYENRFQTALVADDLSQHSSGVAPTVVELLSAMGAGELIHMHIHPDSRENLNRWADQLSELALMRELEHDVPLNKENIFSETERHIQEQLSQRVEFPQAYLEKNKVSYSHKVCFGDITENLTEIAEALKPSFMAFGRHKFLHKHPFTIGRVPFYSMLSLNVPVLIVANES